MDNHGPTLARWVGRVVSYIGSYLKPKPPYKQRLMAGLKPEAVGQLIETPPAGNDPNLSFALESRKTPNRSGQRLEQQLD